MGPKPLQEEGRALWNAAVSLLGLASLCWGIAPERAL